MNESARTYVRRIRNLRKRAYAVAYLRWLEHGELGAAPERGDLSYMAAQAVRLNLYAMTGRGA